jgi:hypothetical protein
MSLLLSPPYYVKMRSVYGETKQRSDCAPRTARCCYCICRTDMIQKRNRSRSNAASWFYGRQERARLRDGERKVRPIARLLHWVKFAWSRLLLAICLYFLTESTVLSIFLFPSRTKMESAPSYFVRLGTRTERKIGCRKLNLSDEWYGKEAALSLFTSNVVQAELHPQRLQHLRDDERDWRRTARASSCIQWRRRHVTREARSWTFLTLQNFEE